MPLRRAGEDSIFSFKKRYKNCAYAVLMVTIQ
jgi:hypothetical protein